MNKAPNVFDTNFSFGSVVYSTKFRVHLVVVGMDTVTRGRRAGFLKLTMAPIDSLQDYTELVLKIPSGVTRAESASCVDPQRDISVEEAHEAYDRWATEQNRIAQAKRDRITSANSSMVGKVPAAGDQVVITWRGGDVTTEDVAGYSFKTGKVKIRIGRRHRNIPAEQIIDVIKSKPVPVATPATGLLGNGPIRKGRMIPGIGVRFPAE